MASIRLVGGPKDGCTVDVEDPGDVLRVYATSGLTVSVIPAGEKPVGRPAASYVRSADQPGEGPVLFDWQRPGGGR